MAKQSRAVSKPGNRVPPSANSSSKGGKEDEDGMEYLDKDVSEVLVNPVQFQCFIHPCLFAHSFVHIFVCSSSGYFVIFLVIEVTI